MLLCRVVHPAWRSVAKGSGTGVRCLAGLWVGDGRCWRTEVGTLVPGRCLGLGNSSCWETKGYLMKARPYVWLDPKGGMIARAVLSWSLYVPCKFLLWIVVLSVELEILFVGLLRHSADNNNNNNVHNTIGMNRDDATLVKSGKFKDCVLSWKFGENVCKLGTRILGSGVCSDFSCDPVRCVVTLLRVHVPGSAI